MLLPFEIEEEPTYNIEEDWARQSELVSDSSLAILRREAEEEKEQEVAEGRVETL